MAAAGGAPMHSRHLSNPEPNDIGPGTRFHGVLASSDATPAPQRRERKMPQLALICPTFRSAPPPTTQWAHDIRNTLTTVGLHLDTLERLAGSPGHKAVEAAHALMTRAAAMCDQALAQASRTEPAARRREVDVVATIRQVAGLLAPIAPAPFTIRVHAADTVPVIADGEQIFRILFNLLHNAVTVARHQGTLETVDIAVERTAATIAVRIADDGPGLPTNVRHRLFRPAVSSIGGSGLGLSIARELAEKNGGMLKLAESDKGTAFVLELPAAPVTVTSKEGPVTRSLGRRAA